MRFIDDLLPEGEYKCRATFKENNYGIYSLEIDYVVVDGEYKYAVIKDELCSVFEYGKILTNITHQFLKENRFNVFTISLSHNNSKFGKEYERKKYYIKIKELENNE